MLVIAKASLRDDWSEKFNEWALMHRPTHILAPDRGDVYLGGERYNLITSYEGAKKHRQTLRRIPWDVIIIDEAHRLKNNQAQRTRAIYGGWCKGFGGVIENARHVWAMSGGPMPNGDPRELYPHLRALNPASILDPYSGTPWTLGQFESAFCVLADQMGGKCVGVRDPEGLRTVLDGWFLRRMIADVLPDLPGIRFDNLYVNPDKVPLELAFDRWPDLIGELEAVIDAGRARDLDWAMQQQVSTIRRLTGLLKADLASQLLDDELSSGAVDQIVVAAWHTDVIETLAKKLQPFGVGVISGRRTSTEQTAARRSFQAGDLRVLLVQIQAGGEGLTLTAAHQVLFVEASYTPMENFQVGARCRRIGQKYPVFARFLTLVGTIDELIQRVNVRKVNMIREVHPI